MAMDLRIGSVYQAAVRLLVAGGIVWCATQTSRAVDRVVGTTGAFAIALAAAQPGDFVTLIPGVYGGGHYRAGLTNVTIRSQDPNNPAIVRGGGNGIQLSDAVDVTLEHLIFEQQTGNGLNIDDGGSFASPSTGITLRNLIVRDMDAGGNNDGIKLSGVTGFLIDQVLVHNWGDGGSAIDPVGSHHGVIQNSIFRHTRGASSGVRPKGGSKDIAIYANRFEMAPNAGRAIQAGGSTGTQYFRFIDGDSGYEASEISAAGNLIIGSQAPFSYVNIDGGAYHHNWAEDPGRWAMRILNENQGGPIVDTQNGAFTDNVVQYDSSVWSQPANVGGETLPATFGFARNQWQNSAGATNINLPAAETDGQYGAVTVPRVGDQIRWDFPWGHWVVNASDTDATQPMAINAANHLLVATPGTDATFDPLAADPLSGTWSFAPLSGGNVQLDAQSQQVLILPNASSAIPVLPGDFDRSGSVDSADYALWKQQFGITGPALADGNGDNLVNSADYTIWRDNLGASQVAGANMLTSVPEPGTVSLLSVACLAVLLCLNFGLQAE